MVLAGLGALALPSDAWPQARRRPPTVGFIGFATAAVDNATRGHATIDGGDITDLFRRAATYVDRILKGAKKAPSSIQLPTKFDLGVNLKTAKALGVDIPASILVRAETVIE